MSNIIEDAYDAILRRDIEIRNLRATIEELQGRLAQGNVRPNPVTEVDAPSDRRGD